MAKAIGIQKRRVDEIYAGLRGITANNAVRLGLAFDVEPQFWLNLQAQYDIEVIQRDQGSELAKEVRPLTGERVAPARQLGRTRVLYGGSPSMRTGAVAGPERERRSGHDDAGGG